MGRNIFQEKLEENYENIGDFVKRSRIPISMETIRRLITDHTPVNTTSLIIIAKYLGFSNQEISDILRKPDKYILPDAKELRFAEEFISLMGFGGEELSKHDKILLQAINELKKKSIDAFNLAIRVLRYICTSEGISSKDLSLLIRK